MAAAVWLCSVKVDRRSTDPVASELPPPQVRQCFMATARIGADACVPMSPRRCTVSASTFVTRCPIVTDIVHTHLCSSNTRRRRVNNSSTYTMSVCEMYISGSFLTSRVLLSKQLECTTNTPAPTNSIHTVYTHVVMSIRWTGHTCVVYRLCISSSATVAVTCDALSEFPKQSY